MGSGASFPRRLRAGVERPYLLAALPRRTAWRDSGDRAPRRPRGRPPLYAALCRARARTADPALRSERLRAIGGAREPVRLYRGTVCRRTGSLAMPYRMVEGDPDRSQLGAFLGPLYAARYPDHVAGLVLAGGASRWRDYQIASDRIGALAGGSRSHGHRDSSTRRGDRPYERFSLWQRDGALLCAPPLPPRSDAGLVSSGGKDTVGYHLLNCPKVQKVAHSIRKSGSSTYIEQSRDELVAVETCRRGPCSGGEGRLRYAGQLTAHQNLIQGAVELRLPLA